MELLGDGGHLESHISPFRDSFSVSADGECFALNVP
jgi:hypothetical protein